MSIRNGRLYQFMLDKLRFAPLALAGAWCVRAPVRAGLRLYAGARGLRAPASSGAPDMARARLEQAFPKPALTRTPALYAPDDPETDMSILVPVYNVGEFFDACMESVYAQETKYRYELILIDDGSDDITAERARAYGARARTRVIRQPNQGAAAARNHALDLAKGEYVMFLDADDLLLPGAIEHLMNAARAHDADWVQGGWEYIDGPRQRFPRAVYEGDARMELIELPGMPWGKALKRALFENLRFPSGYTSYVDTPIKCLTLRMSKRAATIPDIVYAWRRNPQGITFTSKRTPRALQTYWIMEQMQADSEALSLPEDDIYAAIWIRQMLTVNYDRLKGLDERAQKDVFELACEFLKPIIARADNIKLPFALRLGLRAFERRDFALWRMLGKYYALTL